MPGQQLGEYCESKQLRYQTWLDNPKRRKSKKDIDLKKVYEISRCMCTLEDCATILGVSDRAIQDWLETWPEFVETLQRGYSDTRQLLGKKQLDVAFSGNAGMLIWLGKQYLRQSDKAQVEATGSVNIMVTNAMSELQSIDKSMLLEARAVLRAGVTDVAPEQEGAEARPPTTFSEESEKLPNAPDVDV